MSRATPLPPTRGKIKIRRRRETEPVRIQRADEDIYLPPSLQGEIAVVEGGQLQFSKELPTLQRFSERVTSSLDFGQPYKRSHDVFQPTLVNGLPLEEAIKYMEPENRRATLLGQMGLSEQDLIPYPTLDPEHPDFHKVFDPEKYVMDFRYFCESFLKIDSKNKTIIPFKLNPVQLSFLFKRTGRDVILKARQHGFTTLMLAYYLWDTINNFATTTIVLAHEKEPAKRFLNKIRLMYNSLPRQWRPPLKKNAEDHIVFDMGNNITSEIIVQAVKDTAGRSVTCNNLLLSEFAFYGDKVDEDALLGLTEAVPEPNEELDEPGGSITMESTPNGVGNQFYKECQDCENGDSINKLFNIPWFFNPDYGEKWKEMKRKRLKAHTERGARAWGQEYTCSFLQSQRSFFERASCVPKSPYLAILKKDPHGNPYPAWVQIYQEPQPGDFYVIGADVSQGLEHGDFSDATVINRRTRIEVAHIHTKMRPEDYAKCLAWLGRKYNLALVGVEAQQSGHTVLSRMLFDLEYPNLFYHPHENHLVSNRAPPIGWQTNRKTRPVMLEELRAALEEDALFLAYKKRKTEMEVFTYDAMGKPVAPPKFNDDTIISAAIANRLLDFPDMMMENDEVNIDFRVYG